VGNGSFSFCDEELGLLKCTFKNYSLCNKPKIISMAKKSPHQVWTSY
jgi:hypothetical protein